MAELKKLDLIKPSSSATPSAPSSAPRMSPAATLTNNSNLTSMPKKTIYGISALVIFLGVLSGYGLNLYARTLTKSTDQQGGVEVSSSLKVGYTVGSDDERAFKDSAEGVIEKGGLDGEGSHKLVRPGGPSQTVYLTSSVIDLDEFVGHKVKIWGETFAAQKAGWLMDVGRVEVKELNAKVE